MFNKTIFISSLFLFVFLSGHSVAQKGGPKGPVSVIVSSVVKADYADQVEALGTVKANESVVITADRSEKIIQIHFEDGQQVKQGDLLVTLDKTQEEAELRAAEAFTAETQMAYDRATGLSGNSALPKAILQERQAELKQAQAETDALRAALESYEIIAPFDGVLGLRDVSVGTLVQPGDQITTIDDIRSMKIDFDVPSVFLDTLKPDLEISGYVEAFGDREFKGVVRTVNTQIDPVTRTVKVRAVMPNADGLLKPGLLMRINVFKNPRSALLISEEALIKRSDKNFVYVVIQEDGKTIAKQVEITLGARKPGEIEVLSGLKEGNKVVVHGTLKMRDGAEVSIMAEETGDMPLDDLIKQKKMNADDKG